MVNYDVMHARQLHKICTSSEFLTRLKQAGAHVKRTGFEARFEVARDMRVNDIVYSSVAKAKTRSDKVDSDIEPVRWPNRYDGLMHGYHALIMHFHPQEQGPIKVSRIDLRGWGETRIRPISAIGQITPSLDVKLLLYQNKGEMTLEQIDDFHAEYEDARCLTIDDEARFFRDSQLYASEVLTYEYQRRKEASYAPTFTQAKLGPFAFQVDLDEILPDPSIATHTK